MRRYETNPPDAFDVLNPLEKIREVAFAFQSFAVGVDILAKKANLPDPHLSQMSHLFHDV